MGVITIKEKSVINEKLISYGKLIVNRKVFGVRINWNYSEFYFWKWLKKYANG